MVTDLGFTKEKDPGQSWVDLGRWFGMKRSSDREKRRTTASAEATLIYQFFFPAPEGEPIRGTRPLVSDGRSQLLPPLRGGWQVLCAARRSAFRR